MKVGFVSSLPMSTDATAWHSAAPRALRKTLRLSSVKTKSQTHAGVDHYMKTECRVDAYHTQNLEFLDRAYDFDEFGDVDNEYEGLTITDTMSEVELFAFCTGYDIL
jgi:hypothetical protein